MQELIEIYKTLESLGVSRVILDMVILVGVLLMWNTKWQPILDRIKYRRKLTRQAETDAYIISEINEAKDKLLCDRIAVFEFHNSNHNLVNKSFMKHSCTYEVCRSGVPAFNIIKKDIPNGSCQEIIDVINKKSDLIIADIKEYEKDSSSTFLDYMKKAEVKSLILLPIVNNATACGFIIFEFLRSENFNDQELDNLLKDACVLVGKVDHKICLGY